MHIDIFLKNYLGERLNKIVTMKSYDKAMSTCIRSRGYFYKRIYSQNVILNNHQIKMVIITI